MCYETSASLCNIFRILLISLWLVAFSCYERWLRDMQNAMQIAQMHTPRPKMRALGKIAGERTAMKYITSNRHRIYAACMSMVLALFVSAGASFITFDDADARGKKSSRTTTSVSSFSSFSTFGDDDLSPPSSTGSSFGGSSFGSFGSSTGSSFSAANDDFGDLEDERRRANCEVFASVSFFGKS